MFFPVPPAGDPRGLLVDPAMGIRTAQIICVALIAGVVSFLGITLIMQGEPRSPVIAYFGLAVAAIAAVLRFVIPGIVARAQTKAILSNETEHVDARLFSVFQTKMIIGMALLEGAAFFNLVGYLIERQLWSLAVVGLLVLLMAMQFPTLNQFEQWAEDAKRDQQSQF